MTVHCYQPIQDCFGHHIDYTMCGADVPHERWDAEITEDSNEVTCVTCLLVMSDRVVEGLCLDHALKAALAAMHKT